jgi:hypothetical protein
VQSVLTREARTTQPTPAIDSELQVTKTVTGPTDPVPVTKIIVAVHGVGDQYSFATIQSVVNQFCSFYDEPAGVALGNFHTGRRPFSLPLPYPPDPFGRFAFAEVYWAKIPREVVDDKYTLEESKKWARTIIERLRLRWREKGKHGGCSDDDFGLAKQVLSEMIQTIAVLDRIFYLTDRAGLFTFDLRKLLDDYVGDVQIVTEFGDRRERILAAFSDLMSEIHDAFPDAQIYIVAHSEGTVVSFLGLLEAFRKEALPPWAGCVRGFMTLGSPIDKHLVLWPALFDDPNAAASTNGNPGGRPRHVPRDPIRWHNYYDHGDPIGFALDDARAWITLHEWEGVFDFEPEYDHGFTRYPFPGKAHVDYWTDDAVFGHFIVNVLGETRPQRRDRPLPDVSQAPPDKAASKWLSYIVPYVAVATILLIATFVLFKAVVQVIEPPHSELVTESRIILWNVARIALVLFGITVAARVPRLTRDRVLQVAAIGVAALTCLVYYATAQDVPLSQHAHSLTVRPGMSTPILAFFIIGLAYLVGKLRPKWGVTPLMIAGGGVVIGTVAAHVLTARQGAAVGPVWPVFIATAAFLYLWWLAALILDLTVIWHWYIRNGRVLQRMDEMMGGSRGEDAGAGGARGATAAAPQVQH